VRELGLDIAVRAEVKVGLCLGLTLAIGELVAIGEFVLNLYN